MGISICSRQVRPPWAPHSRRACGSWARQRGEGLENRERSVGVSAPAGTPGRKGRRPYLGFWAWRGTRTSPRLLQVLGSERPDKKQFLLPGALRCGSQRVGRTRSCNAESFWCPGGHLARLSPSRDIHLGSLRASEGTSVVLLSPPCPLRSNTQYSNTQHRVAKSLGHWRGGRGEAGASLQRLVQIDSILDSLPRAPWGARLQNPGPFSGLQKSGVCGWCGKRGTMTGAFLLTPPSLRGLFLLPISDHVFYFILLGDGGES